MAIHSSIVAWKIPWTEELRAAYRCLENSMDRGVEGCIPCGGMTERLNNHHPQLCHPADISSFYPDLVEK